MAGQRVNERFDPGVTAELLVEAGAEKLDAAPEVLADGGVENMNRGVDGLVERGLLRRVLALVDITFSSSLIEAWWRSLKHNWLYLHQLDSVAAVRRHVAFYVEEHNATIPHSAFRGQTPDDMYYGRGGGVPDRLAEDRVMARERRMEVNRARQCAVCAWPARDSPGREAHRQQRGCMGCRVPASCRPANRGPSSSAWAAARPDPAGPGWRVLVAIRPNLQRQSRAGPHGHCMR